MAMLRASLSLLLAVAVFFTVAQCAENELNFIFSGMIPPSPGHKGPKVTPLVNDPDGNCPLGYDPTPLDVACDVAIVGTGPGGLSTAWYLVTHLQSVGKTMNICMFDNREHVGGKVQSEEAPNSTPENRLYSPTCAEQLQWGDVRMRCLAQQLNVTHWVRLGTNNFEFYFRGRNQTAPNADLAFAAAGGVNDAIFPPNADPSYSPNSRLAMPDLCADPYCSEQEAGNYTVCSYLDEAMCRLTSAPPTTVQDATFIDYFHSVPGLNQEAFEYLSVFGSEFFPLDRAANQLEYTAYQNNVGTGAAVGVTKGGSQQIWLAMHKKLEESGMVSFHMQESVNCLDIGTDAQSKNYRYVLRSNLRNIRAKRVVLGTPSGQFYRLIKGTLGMQMAASEAVRGTANMTMAATVNLFFPDNWWIPARVPSNRFSWMTNPGPLGGQGILDSIVDPVGRELLRDNFRNFTQWSLFGDTKFWTGLLQYLPTPERAQAHLLRTFYDDEHAERVRAVYAKQGIEGVERWVMKRIRETLTDIPNIPDPTKTVLHFEEFAYARVDAYTPLTNTQIRDYARTPVPGELISFASESFNYMQWGWQEGAVTIAQQVFQNGGALAGLVPQEVQDSWGLCVSTNPQPYSEGKVLSLNDEDSWNDACFALGNEIFLRDLATTVGPYENLYSAACQAEAQTRKTRYIAPEDSEYSRRRAGGIV